MQGARVLRAWRVHSRPAHLGLAESAHPLVSALTVTKVTSRWRVNRVGGVPWNLERTFTVTNLFGAYLCPYSCCRQCVCSVTLY